MRSHRWSFILILLAMANLTAVTGRAEAAAAQVPAEKSSAKPRLLEAKDFHLADFRGKVVLLDFWASWCGPCKNSVPWLVQMQHKYAAQGLVVVPVNLDRDTAKAQKMLRQLGPDLTRVVDPEGSLATSYDLKGMPSSFLYDREGELVSSHLGFEVKDLVKREDELRAVLAKGSGK